MITIPETVRNAWAHHDGPAVFTTVDKENVPNAVYVACVSIYEANRIVIADNYFDKTRTNIHEGSSGAFLFIDKEGKSYQIKGTLEYHTDGPLFEQMKSENPPKHPGHAAAVLCVEEVYSGAEKLS